MDSPFTAGPQHIHPELLALIAKGDRRAFGRLYEQSAHVLFTLCLKILGDRTEAEAVLRDVYTEIWRKGVRYDERRGSPIVWLVTLARNRAVDRRRARTVADTRPSTPDEPAAAPEPTSLTNTADAELRRLVRTALDELPVAQRQTLELAYYDGLSHSQIAQRLNEPVATIDTRLKVSMAKLRSSLKGCWTTEPG